MRGMYVKPDRRCDDPTPTGSRRSMFLLLCVLVAVAPLVLQVAGQRWQVRAAAQQAESKSLISEVGSVIEHDYELARHWFMHQSQSRMLVYGAIAVCFAMFLALRQ